MSTTTTIIGRPGTGKTTRLAELVQRAVNRFGPQRVVVASLTKTAAHEIASRPVMTDGQDRPIWETLEDRVGTLHAICYRALGRPPLVYEHIDGFNETYHRDVSSGSHGTDDLGDHYEETTGGDELLEELEKNRARRVPRRLWRPAVENFSIQWNAWKDFTGSIDFSDMIELALEKLPEGPQGPASAIFYDEAQDGSKLELDLLQQWARHADHAVICGDDLQAIFSWRGGSVEDFLAWSEKRTMLPESHRLPRAVHAAACRWADQVVCKAPGEYRPRNAEGKVALSDASLSYPEDAIPAILEDLGAGKRIMLLATCGYMLGPILGALRDHSVPFWNPHRVTRSDWNPLRTSEKRGSPAGRLLAFSRVNDAVYGSGARIWTWKELSGWTRVMDGRILLRGGRTRLEENSKLDTPVSMEDLEQTFQEWALGPALCGDLEWLSLHIADAKRRVMEFPLSVARKMGVRTLEKEPRVVVGTIHSVKGAETNCTYLWPDLSPSAWEEYEGSGKDDVLRTFYVGMTRCNEKLTLCAASSGYSVEWEPALEER